MRENVFGGLRGLALLFLVVSGSSAMAQVFAPPCNTQPVNMMSAFTGLHTEYQVNNSSAPTTTVMDVTVKNVCSNVISSLLAVKVDGSMGFGTTSPQTTYHFAIPRFQVGNSTTVQFKIDNTANNENMTFSKAGIELFKVNKDGKASAREFEVTLTSPFPDYVFEKGYTLTPLSDVEAYINQNGHLPGIQSASDYAEQGAINMGELQLKMLEKIEELTLYIIAQQKDIEALKQQLAEKK